MIPKDTIEIWEDRYGRAADDHSRQNMTISRDFLKELDGLSAIRDSLALASRILEFGCGTGELSRLIKYKFNTPCIHGLDISSNAVVFANEMYSMDGLSYITGDIMEVEPTKGYDLAIASNVMEHFQKPFVIIDRLLEIASFVLVITPYNQPCRDGYKSEGGMGHVFTFNEEAYADYMIEAELKFKTPGWQHSSDYEEPIQWAVLLSLKDEEKT